jgi:hypothetical protein
LKEIRFIVSDETYSSIEFYPGTDYPDIVAAIRKIPQITTSRSLDGIFEFNMDLAYRNREFIFHWDDQMRSAITFSEMGLAGIDDRALLLELANLICGIKPAGPPPA